MSIEAVQKIETPMTMAEYEPEMDASSEELRTCASKV